mmetsp:Transcript_19715/g.47609  ORF Transcript_19715/g.47609 Transcript_19715/m.47609 type:complete len:684 (+) Transcript_19715:304-2355(+)
MKYLLPVLSLGFFLVNSSLASPDSTTTGSSDATKTAPNIRSRGLKKDHPHQQQLNHHENVESNSLRHRQLDEEEWSPAVSPTYFELDEGQTNFQLPPRTDTETTSSESATPNEVESKNWVVPTIIFTTAFIIIIALAICIYQRRDDFDTDAESYNSDSVYEYEQGRRRRPTINQYAEALMAIGRNNARDVPKHLPDDDDSGDVSGESGSTWGSWMNSRRRRRHEQRSARRGRRPKSTTGRDTTVDRGRGSDRDADFDRNRRSSRGGGGGPEGKRNGSRSRSKGPRGDVEDQSDTSDDSEVRSANKSVTFLKSALKKENERKQSRSRSLSPSAERSLRKIPRSVSVESEEYPSITVAPTDMETQEAQKDAQSVWCFLPSFFAWGDTNTDTDIKPLPRPPPPTPASVNHFLSKDPTKKKERATTTYYSSRGSSHDMYGNDNDSASTGGSSRKCRNFDEVGSLAEVRARELMLRLEKEKQKEKTLERQRLSKLTPKEYDRRPHDNRYRRESSSRDARSNEGNSRRDSSRDARPRPDELTNYRRSSSRDAPRPKDYSHRRSSSRDALPEDYSHRRSSSRDALPGSYSHRRSSSRDALPEDNSLRRSSSRDARRKDFPDSYRRDLSDSALPNDYSYRRDSSQQNTHRRSRSMEPKRTRFDDDDLYRNSFRREENDVEFQSRDRRYDRR